MKKTNKILLTSLVLLSTVLGMTACGNSSGGGKNDALELISDGTATAEIVFADSNNTAINKATKIIQSATKTSGTTLDAVAEKDADEENTTYQILIGATSVKAVQKAMDDLEENSFSVTVSGNKIILAASNDFLYPLAAQKLVETFKTNGKTLSLEMKSDFTSESYDALSFIKNGKCDYTIVYAAGDDDARKAASKIQTAIKNVGANISMKEDSEDASGKELLVGKTNRDLSYKNEVYHKVALIQKDDKENIAVCGNLKTSAELFAQYIEVLGTKGDNVDLLDSMFGSLSTDFIGLAPLYNGGGTVEILDSFEKSNSYYTLVHQATREDYTGYTDLLKKEGFKLHTSSETNGNIFETWTDGYTILTMSHIAYTDPATIDMVTESLGDISYMSIAVDCIDNSALPIVETDTKAITTEQLTLVGTQHGHILRLADGRFVIFDGGMPEQAEKIYKELCEQNELEGKPVVAAWFLTHGHIDHIGAINTFVQMYAKEVEVQAFVHNLPAYELYYEKNTWEASSSDPDKHYVEAEGLLERSNTYYEVIEKCYPNAKIIVAHAGQRFEYGDIDIDVLFTSENIYRKQVFDTNMTSVSYSVTGKTGRMIVLGDSVDITCPMINAIYGSTLKCNLVQVAHHGYNGGNAEMYANMAADFAVWTNSYETVRSRGLHLKASTPRNKFDYTTVSANIIPKMGPDNIILSSEMTKDDIIGYWGDMLP